MCHVYFYVFSNNEKKCTARYDVGDLYPNGTLDLGHFFQRFDLQACKQKIIQLKVAP